MDITADQLNRLESACADLAGVLTEIRRGNKASDAGTASARALAAIPEPRWVAEYRRSWLFLKELQEMGGRAHWSTLSELARAHGYDPRGLGGFYNGLGSLAVDGEERVLTEAGERYLKEYAHLFESEWKAMKAA